MRARCRGSVYVFPAETRLDRSMSENTILYLLYRMGFKGRMTGHGWRTVASTWVNERGYTPDAIERQLAHAPEDQTRAAYMGLCAFRLAYFLCALGGVIWHTEGGCSSSHQPTFDPCRCRSAPTPTMQVSR